MGRPGCPGPGPKLRFWHNIFDHYTIVSRKSQIKMRTRRAKSPCFSARGGREIHFWGIFFQNLQENSFLPLLACGLFHTAAPCNQPFPRGRCGKLCGNCEKPLSPCGFSLSPVFTMAFVYVNEPAYFSFLERKSPFFCLENTPKIQAESGLCPPYLVSSGERANFFPTVCPQGFNIHFISCPGAFRAGWKTV